MKDHHEHSSERRGDQPRRFTPSDSTGTGPRFSPAPPEIPDHELFKCIGRGAYGEVWLARNIMGIHRAVKIVYRDAFEHEDSYQREFEGIRAFEPVSRKHGSQVDVLHIGYDDHARCFYYVMELANAVKRASTAGADQNPSDPENSSEIDPKSYSPRTLKSDLAARKRIPCGQCLEIALSLTTALEHLHLNGLVHRDIKPSNIIFVDGIPKLADIGLVASMDRTLSLVETIGYIPPEGISSPQADVFALGKVLYQMSMRLDRQEFPKLPADIKNDPHRDELIEFNSVLMKACQNDPKDRYQSAEEMHADLLLLQSGKSIRRLRWLERRQSLIVKSSLAAVVITLAAVGGFFVQKKQAERMENLTMRLQQETERVRRNAYVADVNLAWHTIRGSVFGKDRRLLDNHIPINENEDLRGWEWDYINAQIKDDKKFKLGIMMDRVREIAISADNKLIACSDWRGVIRI